MERERGWGKTCIGNINSSHDSKEYNLHDQWSHVLCIQTIRALKEFEFVIFILEMNKKNT